MNFLHAPFKLSYSKNPFPELSLEALQRRLDPENAYRIHLETRQWLVRTSWRIFSAANDVGRGGGLEDNYREGNIKCIRKDCQNQSRTLSLASSFKKYINIDNLLITLLLVQLAL